MDGITLLMAGVASLCDDLQSADVDWATGKVTAYELAEEISRISEELAGIAQQLNVTREDRAI